MTEEQSLVDYYELPRNTRRWAQFIDDLLEARLGNRNYFICIRNEPQLFDRLCDLIASEESIFSALTELQALRRRFQIAMNNRSCKAGDHLIQEMNLLTSTIVLYYLESENIVFLS